MRDNSYKNILDDEEKQRMIETQRKLSVQDQVIKDQNESISQLEGRIATNNFQG